MLQPPSPALGIQIQPHSSWPLWCFSSYVPYVPASHHGAALRPPGPALEIKIQPHASWPVWHCGLYTHYALAPQSRTRHTNPAPRQPASMALLVLYPLPSGPPVPHWEYKSSPTPAGQYGAADVMSPTFRPASMALRALCTLHSGPPVLH